MRMYYDAQRQNARLRVCQNNFALKYLKNEYAKMALLNLLHYNYRLKAVLGTNWIQKYEDYLSHTY